MKEIVFFLGSGCSYPSGLPNVDVLTDKILKTKLYKDTTGNFTEEIIWEIDTGEGDQVQEFIFIISDQLERNTDRVSNYEDIYDALNSLDQFHSDRKPGYVFPFYNSVLDLTTHLRKPTVFGQKYFNWLVDDAFSLIENVIYRALVINHPPQGYDILKELSYSKKVHCSSVVTTNHDLLLERFFRENGITFFDGFDKEDGDITWYTSIRNSIQKDLRLIKLHGSINWHSFRVPGYQFNKIGKSRSLINGMAKNAEGRYIDRHPNRPVFLSGSSKKDQYHTNIYFDMFSEFQSISTQSDTIVISGYGWNDLILNQKIFDLLRLNDSLKLVFLHGDIEGTFRKESGSYILRHFEANPKQCKIIPKFLSDINLKELEDIIEG